MKKHVFISGIVLFLCLFIMIFSGVSTPLFAADKADNADIDSVAQGNNTFAIDLYSELAKDKGNLFFSPYSVSAALTMTYAGAREETARQISDTLHFSLTPEKLHPALSDLMATFNAGGKSYQLSVANALWGQTGYKFLPEFLEVTNQYYNAGFKDVDYIDDNKREEARRAINQWVEEQTHNKIRELIKPKILNTLTRLVLTNAIYFKGKWELQFKPKDTTNMPFLSGAKKSPNVPMMHQTAKFKYTENSQAQVLEMPYTGGDLAMAVLLPKDGYGLEKLEGMLSGDLQSWFAGLSEEKVEVFLPRFKLEKEFLLNEELQALGIKDAFEEGKADFSGMAENGKLYITNVIHKAFVEVNEEGTEASAATGVVVGTKSAPMKKLVFRADRPFIFLIRDLRSGGILFMGRLTDPR